MNIILNILILYTLNVFWNGANGRVLKEERYCTVISEVIFSEF